MGSECGQKRVNLFVPGERPVKRSFFQSSHPMKLPVADLDWRISERLQTSEFWILDSRYTEEKDD